MSAEVSLPQPQQNVPNAGPNVVKPEASEATGGYFTLIAYSSLLIVLSQHHQGRRLDRQTPAQSRFRIATFLPQKRKSLVLTYVRNAREGLLA